MANGTNGTEEMDFLARWRTHKGRRPARIANCSGAKPDPGYQMLRQATQGDVDFITGDWLAEMNLADYAEAYNNGKHDGWEANAWDALEQTIETAAKKKIKIIINGGGLNPAGLARKTEALRKEKDLDLTIAYVEGDNLLPEMREMLSKENKLPPHLDSEDEGVGVADNAYDFLDKENKPLVSANAYLGARGIVKALEHGADVVICGRVADASPVIGAAWYWHSWSDTDYDCLAGALIAGHLIECSAYVTGANFAGFTDYDLDNFVDVAFGIAEVDSNGTCVITKHEGTNGMVTEDTVLCQFLYELQGDIYLNSDVKAYIDQVEVSQVGPNRVAVRGIRGAPPPPTTKLAIFYKGGYQSEYLLNATGYGTAQKFALQERQVRTALAQRGLASAFDILAFQTVALPAPNPRSQLESTTYLRIFAQATTEAAIWGLVRAIAEHAMQHYSGMHGALDHRTALPLAFNAYYPALYPQSALNETATLLTHADPKPAALPAGHPPAYEPLEQRPSYDTPLPALHLLPLPTRSIRLGDLFLARSGDKGANVNFGIYPKRTLPLSLQSSSWDWLRTYLTVARLSTLLGPVDSAAVTKIERVEFPRVRAVHFVIYGLLGRGVSSAVGLDPLGKGFADYMRDKVVGFPVGLLEEEGVGSGWRLESNPEYKEVVGLELA